MHNRISKIIATLGIKRIDFARKIGISSPFVSELCSGAKKASDRTIKDICREFNVNETWLRTGEGAMFVPVPSNTLDVLTSEYELSHDARVLVEEFVNLKPEAQQIFIDFARKAAEGFRSKPPAAVQPPCPEPASPPAAELETDVSSADIKAARAEAEEYYREKLLEKRMRTSQGFSQERSG